MTSSYSEAKKRLKVAEHLLNVTYPMVREPKLLLTVLDNLCEAFMLGAGVLLELEDELPPSRKEKLDFFFKEVAPKHGINEKTLNRFREMLQTQIMEKESPVEFSKGEQFVICSDRYDLETLNEEKVKSDLEITKNFIIDMEGLNAGIA